MVIGTAYLKHFNIGQLIMRPPARSRRAVTFQEDTADAPTAVQALHVTIPLKPQQTPTAVPPLLTQAVKDEFAIRYLQGIGASSTPENIAMVLQHLPMEKCAVTAAWKSRGSLSDVLAIDLNPKALTQAGQTPVKLEGRPGIKREEASNTSPMVALLSPRRQIRGQQAQHIYQIGTVCFTFDDMKRKFLLPFKLATPLPQPDVLQLYAEIGADSVDTLSLNQAEEPASNTTPGSPIALGAIAKWEAQRRRTSVDERRVPPEARTETVTDMHNEFYLTLPLASLGLTEGGEDTRTVLYGALLSPAMIELVQSTVRYLFLTVIHTSSTARKQGRADTEQDTLFVSIAQNFAMLRSKLERKQRSTPRPQLAVLVPLLLLALRVDVETLVRLQYPMSFSCAAAEMDLLLQTLDARISQLIDPDANWSRLAALETTHEAGQARASSTFQRARRHRHLRDQYFQTSSVLHGLFPDPSSGRSRRVMSLRGGAGISHYPDLSTATKATPFASSSAPKHKDLHNPDTVSVASKLSLLRSLRRSQQTKAQHTPQERTTSP